MYASQIALKELANLTITSMTLEAPTADVVSGVEAGNGEVVNAPVADDEV